MSLHTRPMTNQSLSTTSGTSERTQRPTLTISRGEFFFYMHRQMLIRYNVERLTQGLEQIKPLTPDTWDKPLPLGYFPKLTAETGTPYQGRPDNMILANLTYFSLNELEDVYLEIKIHECVQERRSKCRFHKLTPTDGH